MPFATSLRLGLVIARESGKGVPDRISYGCQGAVLASKVMLRGTT
jgi:hypothetical protein